MSTFTAGTALGALIAYLTGLDPETLQALFGCLFGAACAVCAIYVYLLARQPVPLPVSYPTRQPQRRPVRRAQRYPRTWPLAGQMALRGGVA